MNNSPSKIESNRMLLSCTVFILISFTVILSVISCSGKPKPLEAVDLGLPSGTLWANFNVGASNPFEQGDYYAWGDPTVKSVFEWSTLKYCEYNEANGGVKFSKYVLDPEYGTVDGKTVLEPEDDAAAVNWGDGWRIPTIEEWDELRRECKCLSVNIGSFKGFIIQGKNGNSIFLPKTGHRFENEVRQAEQFGEYSSSSIASEPKSFKINSIEPLIDENSYYCVFSKIPKSPYADLLIGPCRRYYGLSVRPVKSGKF